jgi:hypothetical protein
VKFLAAREFFGVPIPNWKIDKTMRSHHKGMQVSPLSYWKNFALYAFFAVKCLLWFRCCRAGFFVVNEELY